MTYSIGFVVLFGMSIVFFGLVCIVLLILLMGAIMRAMEKKPQNSLTENAVVSESAENTNKIRPAVLAAIMAAISEDSGIPFNNVNIVSIKKIER